MYITSVAKALPENFYSQEELTGILEKMIIARTPQSGRVERLKRFHESVQVRSRHFALGHEAYQQLDTFTKTNDAFIEVGSELGAQAISACLAQVQITPREVDAIFFTTVTGLAVPTIDARLMNRLGLRRDCKRIPLFGLGCLAGAAGVARMHDYLRAYPEHVAVLLSVELCSLTLQLNDLSVANMISTGLFGDGAAAVCGIGTQHPRAPASLAVVASKSAFYYDTERVMGWDIGSDGFKIVLSESVSTIVSSYLCQDIDTFLEEHHLRRADITTWVCHPGGPKILRAMQAALGLSPDDLGLTWNSLATVGNLSSSSVLFVLADTLKERPGKPGSYGLMMAMGPGFCSELVLLQWCAPHVIV